MGEEAGDFSPSAQIPQAVPAWVLVQPVEAVLCLTRNGMMWWAEEARPQS